MLTPRTYRQGDLLLREIPSLKKEGLKRSTDPILIRGEATKHIHRIMNPKKDYNVYDQDGMKILVAKGKVIIDHIHETLNKIDADLHPAIEVDEGIYEVFPQREYQAKGWRSVVD